MKNNKKLSKKNIDKLKYNNKYSNNNIIYPLTPKDYFLQNINHINTIINNIIKILFSDNICISFNLDSIINFINTMYPNNVIEHIKNTITFIYSKNINILFITQLENTIINKLQSEYINTHQILKIVNSNYIYYIKINIPNIENYISLIQASRFNKIRCYINYYTDNILNLQYLLCTNTKKQIKKYVVDIKNIDNLINNKSPILNKETIDIRTHPINLPIIQPPIKNPYLDILDECKPITVTFS